MDTNAHSDLNAVAEVERTIQFQPTRWADALFGLLVGGFAAALTWPVWLLALGILIVFVAYAFLLRHRLFGPQRTRLHPNEDPFDDPKIRGSWPALIASLVTTALVFVGPNETVWVTVAAGIVGTLAGILYLRDNQP
ncbi:hypothetical protein [Corynebacterium cystitidis]|uniref:Uncharacterized protein n=1 Tax=Corynebacterium cystitidis DSM 20524 TaxID=1121357 RepID=A0A1H9SLN8_9CORY|nr:hypothetical protein [Corynebacterium cystitidis]WJY83090.1 hypothetical protein CCYS_10960 [Corynebacterium cystitidis DSM 20524]SER85798.1 hypothetical protein SAMN05661109_01170 [Corynebacterium cystitidis DSM 20524]SNV66117.1 Uncharacterised protein [Corynebacterium cystitidis]